MARSKQDQQDPTGQAGNRKSATRALNARLFNIQQFALRSFRAIPKKRRQKADIVNNILVSQTFYEYEYSNQDQKRLQDELQFVANQELLESQDDPIIPFWYWSEEIETPYRQGTIEETVVVNNLVDDAIAAGVLVEGVALRRLRIESVLLSEPYRSAVARQINTTIPTIKGLSTQTSSQVMGVINRGIEAGKSPRVIADEIINRFDVARSSAERTANTEINKAYNDAKMNLGKISGQELGVRTAVLHVSALLPTTRSWHAARHGNTYTYEAQLSWWNSNANRINCFVPETNVSGRFTAGAKSFYRGKVVKLMTRDGRSLTVTPNHKIMTSTGLVPSAKINKGDYLVAHSVEHKNPVGVVDLYVHKANATIEQVFGSLNEVGHSSSVGVMGVDFNGDERFMDEKIDTVFTERVLSLCSDASVFDALDNIALIHSDSPPVASSSFLQRIKAIFTSSPGILCISGVSLSLFFRHIFSPISLGLAFTSGNEPCLGESIVNHSPRNAVLSGYSKNALPANVLIDEVVSVDILDFSGHVYDLQELSGLMVANGIIASNCHCTIQTILVDRSGQPIDKSFQNELKEERAFFKENQ